MNTGRQPTIGFLRPILEKMGLLEAYVRGEVFFRYEFTLNEKNPMDSEIRLIRWEPDLSTLKRTTAGDVEREEKN